MRMNLTEVKKHAPLALAFVVPLTVYALTLCPTVYWADSGELITASFTLGIPHPPGHPLYAILGKVFSFLPVGSIAWRVNFMSAFFGAVACILVYMIILDQSETHGRWKSVAALGGALFFGFAPAVWDHATIAETTTLHCFFMMLLTFMGFRMTVGRPIWKNMERSQCIFALVYGLSFTNHVAAILFFPGFAYLFVASFGKKLLTPRLLLKMIGFFAVGLLVYAYLPIRSLSNPAIDWGNPETLENFLWVVTARQYGETLVSRPHLYGIWVGLASQLKDIVHQFTIVGSVLACLGIWTLFKAQRKMAIFSFAVITAIFWVGLNEFFISAYFVPGLALIALWIGLGLQKTLMWGEHLGARIGNRPVQFSVKSLICGSLALSFLLPLILNYRTMDRSDSVFALRLGEQILDQLPERAIILPDDDYGVFVLWYLKYCEGRRPDITVLPPTWVASSGQLESTLLEQYPDLRIPSGEAMGQHTLGVASAEEKTFSVGYDFFADQRKETAVYKRIQAVMDANSSRGRVYWGLVRRQLPFREHLVPFGYIYEYRKSPSAPGEHALARNREFWQSELAYMDSHPAMKNDDVARRFYPLELNNQALMFRDLGRDDLAQWAIETALAFNPEFALTHYNLGNMEARAGRYEDAIREYKEALKEDPRMAIAHNATGNIYRKLGRFKEALDAYGMAIRLNPDFSDALGSMGQIHMALGEDAAAVTRFRQAIDADPDNVLALRGLATVYLEGDQFLSAEALLTRALKLEPNSAPVHLLLAKYHARAGDERSAAAALRKSVEFGGNLYVQMALGDRDLSDLTRRLLAGESPD